jgi:hypothetical protein
MHCKYKNKVCFIQSEQVFEWEEDDEGLSTVRDYLKIKKSQFLESNDVNKIYKFIHNHAKKNSIRKFVCHIDSGVLEKLMDKMVKEKKNSSVRSLLNKCTFVSTYSNANATRDKNKETGSMFYFSLSDLVSVLSTMQHLKEGTEKETLLCTSDSISPYFQQIENSYLDAENTTLKKVKISKLDKPTLDEFANAGYLVIAALDTFKEYEDFTNVMINSDFRKQIMFIENVHPDATKPLESAGFSNIQVSYSGVCINAPPSVYSGLNSSTTYEICAAVLTVCWKSWSKFKESGVLALK